MRRQRDDKEEENRKGREKRWKKGKDMDLQENPKKSDNLIYSTMIFKSSIL